MGELSLVAGNPELEWAVYGTPVSSDTSPFNDEVMGAVEASLTQLQYPERTAFLEELGEKIRNSSTLASIEEIERGISLIADHLKVR